MVLSHNIDLSDVPFIINPPPSALVSELEAEFANVKFLPSETEDVEEVDVPVTAKLPVIVASPVIFIPLPTSNTFAAMSFIP